MRKFFLCVGLIIAAAGFAAAMGSAENASFKAGDRAWVSAKTLSLKSSAAAFASSRGTLNYGDQVTVLQVNGSWVELVSAANPSLSGWASSSILTSKKITASTSTGATASEIALAGKGFNEEVENAYKAKEGAAVDYTAVDKVETITVPEDELKNFIVQGHLKGN
jgi:hypothetical protein